MTEKEVEETDKLVSIISLRAINYMISPSSKLCTGNDTQVDAFLANYGGKKAYFRQPPAQERPQEQQLIWIRRRWSWITSALMQRYIQCQRSPWR